MEQTYYWRKDYSLSFQISSFILISLFNLIILKLFLLLFLTLYLSNNLEKKRKEEKEKERERKEKRERKILQVSLICKGGKGKEYQSLLNL